MAKIKVVRHKGIVYVEYTHENKSFLVSTEISVKDEDWNGVSVLETNLEYKSLNARIQSLTLNMITVVTSKRDKGENISVDSVRSAFRCLDPRLSEKWREYIALCNQDALALYTFVEFCRFDELTPTIDTLDVFVISRYIQYMILRKKMDDTSIQEMISGLKQFLSWAYPKKYLGFVRYEMLEDNRTYITITETELLKIANCDPPADLEPARDLFLFWLQQGSGIMRVRTIRARYLLSEILLFWSMLRLSSEGMKSDHLLYPNVSMKLG